MAVKKGDSVKVHYKGTVSDGEVFDSSEGRDPLGFTVGSGQVIEGFEEGVVGMEVGEVRTVNIPCAKAYGEHNPQMVIEAPLEQVPADLKPEEGMVLEIGAPNGDVLRAIVTGMTESHLVLDANPPLAGQDLTFEIELVEVG